MRIRCCSSLKRTCTGSSMPPRSTYVHSWPLIRMSLIDGSFSSGSIGPSPVISSRISETKSFSSWVFSASRSTTTYWLTSCWTCSRISASGSFSSAPRLTSSIRRRCSLTLASSSLSLSSGLAGAIGVSRAGSGSGNTVQEMPSNADETSSSAIGTGAGSDARRVEKRLAMPDALLMMSGSQCLSGPSARQRKLEFFGFGRRLAGRGLGRQPARSAFSAAA